MKILRDVKEDSGESKFCEILLVKYCYKTMEKTITEQFVWKKLFHTTTYN